MSKQKNLPAIVKKFRPEEELYSNQYSNRYYDDPLEMINKFGFPLINSFVQSRSDALKDDPKYLKNVSAIQIMNSNNNPIIHSGMSNSFLYPQGSDTKAHAERIVLKAALDNLISNMYNNDPNIQSPTRYAEDYYNKNGIKTIPKNNEYEKIALDSISAFDDNNPHKEQFQKYQNLLSTNNHVVNLITERPPCYGKAGCKNFLERMLPKYSHVGYITKFPNLQEYIKKNPDKKSWLEKYSLENKYYDSVHNDTVKEASEQLRDRYQNYHPSLVNSPSSSGSNNNLFADINDDDLFASMNNIENPLSNSLLSPFSATTRNTIVQEFPSNSPLTPYSTREEMTNRYNREIFGSSDSEDDMSDNEYNSVPIYNINNFNNEADVTLDKRPRPPVGYYSNMGGGSDSSQNYNPNPQSSYFRKNFRQPYPRSGYVGGQGYI